jgi:hypothetical protein
MGKALCIRAKMDTRAHSTRGFSALLAAPQPVSEALYRVAGTANADVRLSDNQLCNDRVGQNNYAFNVRAKGITRCRACS